MFEHFSAPLHEKLECATEYGIGRRPEVIPWTIEPAGHTAGVYGRFDAIPYRVPIDLVLPNDQRSRGDDR
jgi:hypothetical protein